MLRVILSLAVMICLLTAGELALASKTKDPAISTEGTETESVELNTRHTKEQKDGWKQKRKANRIYFKTKKQLEKQNYKKEKKEKEIEYLQKRLELKKEKLETLNPTEVKGEEEK